MKRIFIGIEIERGHKRINDHIEVLKNVYKNIKIDWERCNKMHITLKFLGNITDEQLILVKNAMTKFAKYSSFPMYIENTGCFPFSQNARVLWLGVGDPTNTLQKIYADIEKECEIIGFSKETRAFTPHLTIARIKQQDNKSKNIVNYHLQKHFDPIELNVSKITIYESLRQVNRPIYSIIDTINLK